MDISSIGDSSMMHAMSGASSGMPPQQKMSRLFDTIDNNGAGSISQTQFDKAFQNLNPPSVFQQQGSDAIFAALDPNGTGSVSKKDFVSGMSQLMASLRADTGNAPGPSPADSLAASLQSLNAIDPASISPNTPPGSLINTKA
ncbi:MAG: EF-hand domain-containing protein [Xanthobacteraceae bacterium]